MNKSLCISMLITIFSINSANAALIDFESVPGGLPADKLLISSQYQLDYGVTFSLSNGNNPFLEAVGGSDTGNGFINDQLNRNDTAAVGFESVLGNFYLRIGTGNFVNPPLPSLVISYDTPVSGASAQIWDIDGTNINLGEQWRVDALDNLGGVIESILSPRGIDKSASSLDGKPWTWSFDHGSNADIYQITVTYVGNASNVGLAFDNFSPSSPVPLPPAIWLFGTGLLGLIGISRCKTVA